MKQLIAFLILLGCGVGCTSAPKAASVLPPPMPRRPIAKPDRTPPFAQIEIEPGYTLFVPYLRRLRPVTGLTVHFHGEPWFVLEEHMRRGSRVPLLCVALGQGSSVYRVPFEDQKKLSQLVEKIQTELQMRVVGIDISSFSAGYGAVREIVKVSEYRALIHRIVLCDSMYASFAPGSTTRPAAEHIEPWVEFAKMAAKGEKTFVLTHSQVPTATYANTAQCAAALIEAVGGSKIIVPRGSIPATLDPEFPLLTRSDVGHFHVFGYDGADAQAHLTHIRHLADVWKALDEAGEP
jgi:hypothetical protein